LRDGWCYFVGMGGQGAGLDSVDAAAMVLR
jgi:hypothetical protein